MKADFSRDTFRRHDHFARVLMQQGRVLMDADWNEQVSILLEQNRRLAADLIGPHGGPGKGFLITCTDEPSCDFKIAPGRYYIDGIACELAPEPLCPLASEIKPMLYSCQPHYPVGKAEALKKGEKYVVYLDIWERHLNTLQADDIREVALGGPDTSTRAQIVCQVKIADLSDCEVPDDGLDCDALLKLIVGERLCLPRCLRARAKVEMPSEDPCLVPPTAQYRGPENQLYRVEIHHSGIAGGAKAASFKWSRDNGSVVFAIASLHGAVAKLASLGRDQTCDLKVGDWVEIVDDQSELLSRPRPLLKVVEVDLVGASVTLSVPEGMTLPVFYETSTTHPLLRRWDQNSDAIPVQESRWIELEDGVQVWFEQGGDYKIGDYWLIPARTAIGDVLWPTDLGPDGNPQPKAQPPLGIAHHIAPLSRINVNEYGHVSCELDCRCVFPTLCGPATPEPSESTVPLGAVEFQQDEDQILDTSLQMVKNNAKQLNDALNAGKLVRVTLTSFTPESGESSKTRAGQRATTLRDLYKEGGIPARHFADTVIVLDDSASDRVETEMVVTASSRLVPLTEVNGIGDVLAERLNAAGIMDVATLVRLDPDRLVQLLTNPNGGEFPRARAVDILRKARTLPMRAK